ncbi:MAG: hypothetical protein FWE34_07265 [Defluviitaleaceae bacterium]|nr:hypothetical protein [Defluviitaleaceae bacterium]
MKLSKSKFFTAMLLAFVLAFAAPMSLFASAWDGEQGQAFFAELEELFGEMRSEWVVEDLEILREHGILCDEEFYALLEMGVADALAHYLADGLLSAFWDMDESGRFWLLYDELLDLWLYIDPWHDWGWGWDDDWSWDPWFSDAWLEEGSAFRLQLVETLGELHASWIAMDLDWMLIDGIIDEDTYAEILATDLNALLVQNLTPSELTMFWNASDEWLRYEMLWWDIMWDAFDLGWGDWVPEFSAIWYEMGASFRTQLVDIMGEMYASWVAMDIDWDRDFIGEDVFFEILQLDIMEFVAEHRTDAEIASWLSQEDEWEIWIDFWNLLRAVYWPDWDDWGWSDWSFALSAIWDEDGKGAALMAQLVELLGEDRAIWTAEDIDWANDMGRLTEEALAEILALDLMAELQEFFGDDFDEWFAHVDEWNLRWDIWDFIIEPIMWAAWGDIEISREDIAQALDVVIDLYFFLDSVDVLAIIATAEMTQDDLVDVIYSLFNMFDMSMWWWASMGDDWLVDYIDNLLWEFRWGNEESAISHLLFLSAIGRMYDIIGDYLFDIMWMPVIFDLENIFSETEIALAMYGGDGIEIVWHQYGSDLMRILDFRLHDALTELFASEDNEWPLGLSLFDEMLGGLLSDNLDRLHEFYADGPPVMIDFWRFINDWELLMLDESDLEERRTFATTMGTEYAIDFFSMDNMNLNLFYANHADYVAHVRVEFRGGRGFEENVYTVEPGKSITIQLTADQLAGGSDIVWVTIVNIDNNDVNGEFAFRLTQQPLN